jgi:alpha,alpha-trehalase
MRESGFDTSFRFGPFSAGTTDFAPVCLNSLLYKYELDMAEFARKLGRSQDVKTWQERALKRKRAMQKYLWNGKRFVDYNFATQRRSRYNYLTEFYPLWAGWATKQQGTITEQHLSDYETEYGLAMSTERSGMQWDDPFGWAPVEWFAVKGLLAYRDNRDTQRIARKYIGVVNANFLREHTIREKYDMATGSSEVQVTTGYKSNSAGFGWTNGVYREFESIVPR